MVQSQFNPGFNDVLIGLFLWVTKYKLVIAIVSSWKVMEHVKCEKYTYLEKHHSNVKLFLFQGERQLCFCKEESHLISVSDSQEEDTPVTHRPSLAGPSLVTMSFSVRMEFVQCWF